MVLSGCTPLDDIGGLISPRYLLSLMLPPKKEFVVVGGIGCSNGREPTAIAVVFQGGGCCGGWIQSLEEEDEEEGGAGG